MKKFLDFFKDKKMLLISLFLIILIIIIDQITKQWSLHVIVDSI